MTYHEPLSQKAIAISISESAELASLGLAPEHLRDAMAEITRHLLALGARVVYGGDLRANGFTELLFELVVRHRRDADVGDLRPAVINYLAWPAHVTKPYADLRSLVSELKGLAELHFLDRDGADIDISALGIDQRMQLSDHDWTHSLSKMRAVLTTASDARIVLGGRTSDYKGRMPGIAEEALSALDAGQPLFLLGGFGGCARDIAVDMGLLPRGSSAQDPWQGRHDFAQFDQSALGNGLDAHENRILAKTVHVDEAVALILRGLLRLHNSKGN